MKKHIVLCEFNGTVETLSPTVRQCGITALGLKAIQAYLSVAGFAVKIIMQGKKTVEQAVNEILSYNPTLVGATATTAEVPITASALAMIKQAKAGVITVMGGYHASACTRTLDPAFANTHGVDSFGIDFLAIGEGEKTMLDLARAISAKTSIRQIKGLAYFDGRAVVCNERQERFSDLDSLPPLTWSDSELSDNSFNGMIPYRDGGMGKVAAIITERGCPFSCSFCPTRQTYGCGVSISSISRIVDEIEYLVRDRDVGTIVDYAATPNRDLSRVSKFCLEIQRRNLQKTFSMYSPWRLQAQNGKLMITEEIVKLLSETLIGMKRGIGVEALSAEDQAYLDKPFKLENLRAVSTWFDRYGALLRGFHIITPETSWQSVDNCRNSEVLALFDDLRITYLVPFPGTPLESAMTELLITKDWTHFNCEEPVIVSSRMTTDQLQRSRDEALQGFLLNKHRRERVKQKIALHPELGRAYQSYNRSMQDFGFEVLDL